MRISLLLALSVLIVGLSGCSEDFLDGSDGTGPVVRSIEDNLDPSVSAFNRTLYPTLKARCGSCHSEDTQKQEPLLASSTLSVAHSASLSLTSYAVVDLGKPYASRVVQKVKTENHNCWTSDCEVDSETIKTRIEQWASAIDVAFEEEAVKQISNSVVVPSTLAPSTPTAPGAFSTLTFDLASLGLAGVNLKIDIQDYSESAYRIRNPELVFTSGTVSATELYILVNGLQRLNESIYSIINVSNITSADGILSSEHMIVLKDQGPGMDQLSLQFGAISKN